jgi:hypothetical protein
VVASPASQALPADERDQPSKVVDESLIITALLAKGLPSAGTLGNERLADIGEKDLAHEAELRDNDKVQRRLMEQEAIAEQEKNGVAALQMNHTLMGRGLDLQARFQLPSNNLPFAETRMRSAVAMSILILR